MSTKLKTVTMDKIEFKNLPDETTPINATNLNQIQDNVEDTVNESVLTDEELFNSLFELSGTTSYKLKNSKYINSNAISHDGTSLNEVLDSIPKGIYMKNANFDEIMQDYSSDGIKIFAIAGGNLIGNPLNSYNYGLLINLGCASNMLYANAQIFLEDNLGENTNRHIYVRIKNNRWLMLSGTRVDKNVSNVNEVQ